MTYDVSIKIPKDKVLPDVFDWLEVDNDLQWNRDWTYKARPSPELAIDYTFNFKEQASAVLFALRWS